MHHADSYDIDLRSQLPAGLLIKICLLLFGMFHQLITLIHNLILFRRMQFIEEQNFVLFTIATNDSPIEIQSERK